MGKKRILTLPVMLLAICLALAVISCSEKSYEKDDALNTAFVESSAADAQIHAPSNTEPDEPEDSDTDDSSSDEHGDSENTPPKPIEGIADLIAPQVAEEQAAPPAEENQQDEEPPIEDFPYAPFPYAFTAEDIYGNAVTEADLGEKRLFFIHHWATWCGPCVGEMPDLAWIAGAYGDQVGFIGLVDDYQTDAGAAKTIAVDSGVPSSFIMVDARAGGLAAILSLVESGYLPTSVIIDSSGEVFEPKLIGSYGERYAQLLDILLE